MHWRLPSPFFFNDTATTEIYTLSLHDALPISVRISERPRAGTLGLDVRDGSAPRFANRDRKSTRLNSSHTVMSYAVFCLKKKNVLDLRGFLRATPRERNSGSMASAILPQHGPR